MGWFKEKIKNNRFSVGEKIYKKKFKYPLTIEKILCVDKEKIDSFYKNNFSYSFKILKDWFQMINGTDETLNSIDFSKIKKRKDTVNEKKLYYLFCSFINKNGEHKYTYFYFDNRFSKKKID